jgi:hypothetical protein
MSQIVEIVSEPSPTKNLGEYSDTQALHAHFCPNFQPIYHKNAAYPKAFAELKAEGHIPQACKLRQVKYLNHLVEPDHRTHQTIDQTRDVVI